MKHLKADVLIVGSGLAGVRAALEARREGAVVLMVSRAPAGKANNSAISKGFFAVSGEGYCPGDSPGQHMYDIITGGCGVGNPGLVSVMVNNLQGEADFLKECGVSLAVRDDGSLQRSRPPGHTHPRVLGTPRSSGVDIMNPLVARAMEMDIGIEQGITVLSLNFDDSGIYGAWGIDRRGEPVLLEAPAVVISTGGAGGLYEFTNNAPGTLGVGLGMALSAGLPLVDMEFVQFYPTYLNIPGKSRVMMFYETLVAVAGATLRNKNGEDIRELHGLKETSDLTRDRLARAISFEIREGRGVGENGQSVVLDFSTVARPEKFRRFIPGVVSPDASEVHVAPVVHFTMGGIAVKPGGETGIPGLWAVGEVAGGIHGANRIGGNALAECLGLGRAAGGAAAQYARVAGRYDHSYSGRPPFEAGPDVLNTTEMVEALGRVMSSHAGILRDASGLKEGIAALDSLEFKIPSNRSASAFMLGMMLDVARAICLSALAREESRGSHHRLDHPEEERDFQGNFQVSKENGKLNLTFIARE